MADPFTFVALMTPRTDVRSDSASSLASFGADIPVLRGIGLRGTPVTAARVGSDAHR